ncbi:hypothetical protein ABTX81_30775 [Kitasatospora sp. NPDC097605]|uniref:hypothetical protein n=1 Tax=Kitasatospora sp. NPDC097605 TaxID=3157226 RepID=UPI00333048F7
MTTEQQALALPTEDEVRALSAFVYRRTAEGHYRGDRASSAVHNAALTLTVSLLACLKDDPDPASECWHTGWDGLVELAAPWRDTPGYLPAWARFANGAPVPS